MARPPATAEQRRKARSEIRQAAAELAAADGVANVTVRKVAARAGVSVGTVYGHFASLSDLMRSLWTGPVAEANEKIKAVAEAHLEPLDRVRAILESYSELALNNEALHRTTLLFVRPASSPAPDQFPASDLVFYRLLTEAITEAQLAGTAVGGNTEQLAQMLWAGVHGALALPVNVDIYTLEPAEQQVRLMIDTMVDAITR